MTVNVAQPAMAVDTAPYTYISDNDYQIKGWALDASGVNKVDVYIDDSYYGSYPAGGSRPDVNTARNTAGQYGVNSATNSGFTIPIGNNDLGLGRHYIFITAIGSNGTSPHRDMFVYGPRVINQSFNITLSNLSADDGASANVLDPANIENAGAAGQYEFLSLHDVDGFASWSGGIWAGSQGWSSISAAIDGGAKYLRDHWITGQVYGQHTLYEMKWDPYGWAAYDSAACYATDYAPITNN